MKNKKNCISMLLCLLLIFSMSVTSIAADVNDSADLKNADAFVSTAGTEDSLTDENTGDTSGDNTGDTTGDNTGDNTGDSSGDNTGDTTGDNTGDTTGDNTGDSTGDNTGDNTSDNTGDSSKTEDSKTSKKATSKLDTSLPAPKIAKIIRVKLGTTKIYWSAVSKATAYQIQTATKKDFSDKKTITIKKGTATGKAVKGLSKTSDTFVRMRTIRVKNSVKTYSSWGNVCRMIVYKTGWKYAKNSKIHTGTAVLFYTTAKKKKGLTIAINAGHGTKGGSSQRTLCHPDGSRKVTGGSTSAGSKYATSINEGTNLSGGVSEATQNLRVANATKKQLLAAGYNVLMLRQDTDVQLDNIARSVIANRYADAHIALHYDSTSSNKGAFAITVPSSSRYRNMEPVKSHYKEHNALAKKLISGLKLTGVKIWSSKYMALDLTQTSYSTIPSIDLELGDRRTSRSTSTIKKMALGILKGVNGYFK